MARDESYQARKEYMRKWARARYRKDREKRICVYCHKPWNGTRSYCDVCADRTLERRKTKHKEDRTTKKMQGLCPRCGHERHKEADADKVTCFSCRAEAALHKGYPI